MFKKIVCILFCLVVLVALQPTQPKAGNPYSLVITEICRDTTGTDITEAMEVLNVSNQPLDLYDYTLWRYQVSDNDWTKIRAATPSSDNLRQMNLSNTQGKYILQPGELAICWFVYKEVYNTDYSINGVNHGRLAEKSGSTPVYHFDKFRVKVKQDQKIDIPDTCKIIPLDSTLVSGGFNLGNSSSFRLYLTPRGQSINAAIAIADIIPPKSRGNISAIYGPADDGGKVLKVLHHFLSPPNYSQMTSGQQNAWAAINPVIPTISEPADNLWTTPTIAAYDYTFVVIPDTQIITRYLPDELPKIPNYILDNMQSQKIKFAMHLGDITNNNVDAEWEVAASAFEPFRGVLPHSFIPGNHDYNTTSNKRSTNLDSYNSAFPINSYKNLSHFGGAFEQNSMANTYHKIIVNGLKYLILALEFGPRNEVLTWADQVVKNHPDHNVIVTTHAYMNSNGGYYTKNINWVDYTFASENDNWNDTYDMWDKLIKNHKNIIMVICGHSPTDTLMIKSRSGTNNNKVYEITVNGQATDLEQSGVGMLMMMRFSKGGTRITLQYYSTLKDSYYKTENQNLVLTVPVIGTYIPDTLSSLITTAPVLVIIIITGVLTVVVVGTVVFVLIRKRRLQSASSNQD